LASSPALGQNFSLDSLRKIPFRHLDSKAQADIFWKLSVAYRRNNTDSSLTYGRLAIALGKKYDLKEPLGWGYIYAGDALGVKGYYDSLTSYETKGLNIIKQINKREALARAYCMRGAGFSFRYQDDSSIYYFQKSLELGKPFGYVEGYVGLAKIFNRTRVYESGFAYSSKAYRESGPREIETKIRALGMMGEALRRPDTTIILMMRAVKLAKEHHLDIHVRNFSEILASWYIEKRDFVTAKSLANDAYEMARKTGAREVESNSLVHLAEISLAEGENQRAISQAMQAYKIAEKDSLFYLVHSSIMFLIKGYARTGDLNSAALYQKRLSDIYTKLQQEANASAIIDYKVKYETLQKEQENEKLKNQQLEVEATVQQQKTVVVIISLALVLVVIVGVFVIRAYQNKKRMNKLLEINHSAILSVNREIEKRQAEIERQKDEIEKQRKQLAQALFEREEAQTRLVHSEKMASLGQLMAGIAHELNNPITFISAGANALRDHLTEIKNFYASNHQAAHLSNGQSWQEVDDLFNAVLAGVDRTTKIVNSLRTFSYDNSDGVQQVDLIECIEATLIILQSEIKNKIEVQKNYQPIPLVACNAGEISQVFTNILTNAIYAIDGKGDITISTGLVKEDASKVFISIKDTGTGIPEHIVKRIFDPFFTTKPLGKGVGLGLSISYNIIEKHHGSLDVLSEQGKGSEFIIKIPIQQHSIL
jgi:signal transduction histidine kinase